MQDIKNTTIIQKWRKMGDRITIYSVSFGILCGETNFI
jgi:hypothetical protein